jgi:hypothetical protein
MINPTGPPMVAFGTDGPRPWVRVPRAPCEHLRASREWILRATAAVPPGQAIILGGGRCREIPLGELAGCFGQVTLNDHDPSSLEEAISASGIGGERALKVRKLVADLTGVTEGYLGRVAECLGSVPELAATAAAERVASLAETTRPRPFATGQKYDLVIASCVLCQLHLAACNRTIAMFAARYPAHEAAFRVSPSWVRAMYGLARRTEDVFIDALHGLVTPGGRIYLSDTVQSAFLHPTPEGDWITDGVYRMTRTHALSDYLDDRFQVEGQGRWLWVIDPMDEPGRVGRLYNTQALILSLKPEPPAHPANPTPETAPG